MDVLDGGGHRQRLSFGSEFWGIPLQPVGNLLHSCVEVCEPIELSFGVVSGVGGWMGVLDGVHVPQGEEAVFGWGISPHWFQWCICLTENCIRHVRKKLTIFLYVQYIVGIGGSLAFRTHSQV